MSFLAELRRRNVLRVAVAYLVFGWLTLQIVSVVAPILDLPAWVARATLLLLAIGFVAALVVSWIYELTPAGLRRTSDLSDSQSIASATGNRLDRFVLVGLALVAVMFAADRLWPAPGPKPGPESTSGRDAVGEAAPRTPGSDADPAAPIDASIAVLPLANLSGDDSQEYFSDGMSEELLNVLAKVPGLRVAARTSSFQFKGRNLDIQDIARQLNVATVLEGSLRKSGDRIRITAQLIEGSSGFHIWSETYDRKLDDVFAVQDDIAGAIAGKLREHLGLAPATAAQPAVARTANTEAYDAYLRGRDLLLQRSRASVAAGLVALKEAVALDPDYAPAWAQLATAYFLSRRASTGYGDLAPKEGERLSTEALANAKRLDPQLSEVHAIEGVMRQFFQHDLVGALAALDRAIALNPANVQAKFWRVDVLQRSGRFRDGLEERLVIARVDPLFNLNNTALAGDLILLGRRAEAQAFIARVSDPASRLYAVARTAAFAFDGAWDEAALVLAQGLDVDPEDWGRKGALAVGLLMLGIHDFTDETYWAGWQSADLAPAVRGDWQGAVVAFGAIDAATIPTDYWYYRRAQHLFRAGREAEALAQFDAVWPNVWAYGVADDAVYLTPRRLWYAQALRRAGRASEVEAVVQVARDEVAAARRDGMQPPIVDLLEAELAAWDGDRATVLRLLPRGLMVEPFLATVEDDPVYASLRDDAGFLGAIASEQARRAQLRERFLRAACARPAQAKWHPAAGHCKGAGSPAANAGSAGSGR